MESYWSGQIITSCSLHCTNMYLHLSQFCYLIIEGFNLIHKHHNRVHCQLKVLIFVRQIVGVHVISLDHRLAPQNLVRARNTLFEAFFGMFHTLIELPLPVASLWLVHTRHLEVPDSFPHGPVLVESLVLATEGAAGYCLGTCLTIEHIAVAFRSFGVEWDVIALGAVDFLSWFHGEVFVGQDYQVSIRNGCCPLQSKTPWERIEGT